MKHEKTGPLSGTKLDHIAIAVNNLDRARKVYEDLGLKFESEAEVVESEGVVTLFAPLSPHGHSGAEHLELLAPYGESGPIHQYLDKKGEGIHHICLRVDDIDQMCLQLEQKGYRLIYKTPKIGARNMRVNFIHPKSTGGVLIELATCQIANQIGEKK